MTPYERAIAKIGSEAKAAALLGYKTSWGLARHRGVVPPDKVIEFCRAADWVASPHEVRPDLYPHPDDGLPPSMRYFGALAEFAEVLTEDERAHLAHAIARGEGGEAMRMIQCFDVQVNVRAQLLEAAQRLAGEGRAS